MNKITFWAVTASLAGFLFGFDTVVISGADQTLQEIWGSSDLFHGMVVMAMALWGTVLGALLGGIPTDRLGRKWTLLGIGVLYVVSAIGSAMAFDPWSFGIFRFIGGVGVGVSTVAAPAYISEISPASKRGRLVALYQFNLVLGILLAFVSNYLLSEIGEHAWRWMMGVEAIPAVIYTLMIFLIPESPRWLFMRGRINEAKSVMKVIDPSRDVSSMLEQMEVEKSHTKESLFAPKYRRLIMLAFLIAFFNQVSGINAFLYYAPRIFEIAGLEASGALLSSIGIGAINLIFTMFGLYLIDRSGRRFLMYIGSFGYIISLSLVAMAFFLEWKGLAVPIFLFLFIASHAIGQGSVIWVFIAEIFPNKIRAKGQSLGVSTHWVLAAIIPSFVPVLFATVGAGVVFLCFAFMMVLQLLFVHFIMPETKGVALETLGDDLSKD